MHEEHSPLARKGPKLDVAKGAENFLNSNMLGPNKSATDIFKEGAKLSKELTSKIDRFSGDIQTKGPQKRSDLTYLKPDEWTKSPEKHESGFGSPRLLPSLPKQVVLTRTKTIDISAQGDEKSAGVRNSAHQLKHLNQIIGGPVEESISLEKEHSFQQTNTRNAPADARQRGSFHEGSGNSVVNTSPVGGFTQALGEQGFAGRTFGNTLSSGGFGDTAGRQEAPVRLSTTNGGSVQEVRLGGEIAQKSAEVDKIIHEWEERLQVVDSKIQKARTSKDYLTRDIIQLEESLRKTNTSLANKTDKLKELDKLLASAKDSAMKIATSVDGLTTALDREIGSKFKRGEAQTGRQTLNSRQEVSRDTSPNH